MQKTELFSMGREERLQTIEAMDTGLLLSELDDTIQFDILGMSNYKWLVYEEKKVYQAIVNELRKRIT